MSQQPPSSRRRRLTTWGWIGVGCLGVIVLLLVVTVVGALLSSRPETPPSQSRPAEGPPETGPPETGTPEKPPEPAPERYVLVEWKFDNSTLRPNEFPSPPEGYMTVGVYVQVTNFGYDEVFVSPLDFKLEVSGVRYNTDSGIVSRPLQSVTLASGAKIDGYVTFDVPQAQDYFAVLIWDPFTLTPYHIRYKVLE